MTREYLAERLKEAWFAAEPGIPIGRRWTAVADAATAELSTPFDTPTPPTPFVAVDWSGDPVNTESSEPAEVPQWRAVRETPARDHAYMINVTYPDGSEAHDQGTATAAELANRLRFEANLCAPPEVLLPPDEVADGAPRWLVHNAPAGMPSSFAAWNNGVTTTNGDLIEDLDGLESTARAMLAAAAQAKLWRRQV